MTGFTLWVIAGLKARKPLVYEDALVRQILRGRRHRCGGGGFPEDAGSRSHMLERIKNLCLSRELSRDKLGFSLRPVDEGRSWLDTLSGTMPC
jgi:hypothetical protein